ncbi:MAG: UDP-N-acetylmuramate dehydrogenase [Candidatus Doudnabacteria bacterium]|nr:UDP-N-acetylmuramate dehydrogenase [Candidatus Doudnabacteria bacterium]
MKVEENYSLKNLNTFEIEAKARFFVEAASEQEIFEALEFARNKNLEIFVLGGGSNILLSDAGFEGLVIKNNIAELRITDYGLTVGAGENWDDVVAPAVEKNLAGIECLSGVPGTAGGAVVQNIGAYGQTLSDAVSEVHVIEAASGRSKIFGKQECEFEYRNSIFKRKPGKYIVTKVILMLNMGTAPNTSYPHVKKHFEKKPNPTLADVRQFIIKLRASKGYLIMPGYESYKTAGSFFKNPIVSREQFEPLKPLLGDASLNRFWEVPNGMKIAVAFLMEQAGFQKGYREGSVGISPKHSLSLVNFDGAKASEVKALADKIKLAVSEKFGVKLEEEILLVGKF